MSNLMPQAGMLQAVAGVNLPNKTSAHTAAVEAWAEYFRLLKGLTQTRLAFVGDGFGNVNISDRPMFKYIRLGSMMGGVAEARNLPRLDPANDDVVLVRRERPGGLGPWQIVDWYGTGTTPVITCGGGCEVHLCAMHVLRIMDIDEIPGGNAVAVQGLHAYVAQRVKTNFASPPPFITVGNSRLYTVDITNPSAPITIQDMDLGSPMESHSAAVRSPHLWVSGFAYDGITQPFLQPRSMFRYDISDPTTPALVTSVTTDLSDLWIPFEQGADTYLVGAQLQTDDSYEPLLVVDSLTLATIGSIDIGLQSGAVSPLMVGNICIAPCTDLFAVQSLTAVDLTDPTSPIFLWNDTDAVAPVAALDSTHFYARGLVNSYLYDLTVPGVISKLPITDPILFTNVSNAAEGVLVGNCLYKENPGTGTASVFDVSVPLDPGLAAFANTSPIIQEAFTYGIASGDVMGGLLRYCGVGFNSDESKIYLTVFANQPC